MSIDSVSQAAALIEERTGLAASTLFRTDLSTLLRDLANGDMTGYLTRLHDTPEDSAIWQSLIDALTISETYFLRGEKHFRLFKEDVLPRLTDQRRRQNKHDLNIWSVGCASGEEPYSLAITLQEALPDLAAWTVRLIGTDINDTLLRQAQHGVYRPWAFRNADGLFTQRYFTTTEDGAWIKPHIRKMVTFRRANVLAGPPLPQIDIIFCRNVLLYLDSRHTEQAEDILFDALTPGGWLFLGQSEAIRSRRERWHTHLHQGAVVYQKPAVETPGGRVTYNRPTAREADVTPRPQVESDATYREAVAAVQQGEGYRAEHCLADLLTSHPYHARAHTLLASLFANRQATPEAHAHLDTALHADPLLADAHYLKAMLYLEEGKMEDARKALHAAVYCQREHPLASLVLGHLYARSGNLGKAHRFWINARQAVAGFEAEASVSDLNDMTVEHFTRLVEEQLAGLE